MRQSYTVALLLTAIIPLLTQCNRRSHSKSRFRPDQLKAVLVDIETDKDTTLHTPGGAIIRIPAHALYAEGLTKARLLIREAYRMSDMIRAGLLTTSNGEILSSGGMIDIEPEPGQNVKLLHPLAISIPTPTLSKNMNLYKGVRGEDGNINWTDPQPLPLDIQAAALDKGREIFMTNCNSCHILGKALTGPDLAYISGRRDKLWLHTYIRNNARLLAAGDPYTICLFNTYRKTAMPLYPELTDTDIDAICKYINDESYQKGLPLPDDHSKHCADSCAAYQKIKNSLLKQRGNLVTQNGFRSQVERSGTAAQNGSPDSSQVTTNPAPQGAKAAPPAYQKVDPPTYQSEYYQFTIQSYGWYNIDALLKNMEGIIMSELMVKVSATYSRQVNLFLIIPATRTLQEGGPMADRINTFGFYETDGKLPLPEGANITILALGEKDGRPVAGIASFPAAKDLSIKLDIQPISEDKLNARLKSLDLQELSIQASASLNAAAIRKIDARLKNIESLKPVTCDCNCIATGEAGKSASVRDSLPVR